MKKLTLLMALFLMTAFYAQAQRPRMMIQEIVDKYKTGHRDFRQVMLSTAERKNSFSGLDLSGINFAVAAFAGTDFTNTNLKNANFSVAILTAANFEGANLEGANFSGAKLLAAKFKGANIDKANFKGVRIDAEQLKDTKGTPILK